MILRRIVPALTIMLCTLTPAIAQSAPTHQARPTAGTDTCHDGAGATAGTGGYDGHAVRTCDEGNASTADRHANQRVPVTKVIDCGPPQVAGQLRPGPGNQCGQVRNICDAATPARLRTDAAITTTVTVQQNPDGSWSRIGLDCSVEAAAPQVTALMVRQQARKLVPHPGIGIAPPGGATLVNIQTLLWLNTPANQPLGTVTLLGHHVAIRVHIEHVDWNFGDGHTDTTTGPQRKYQPADACRTVSCPGYWGHTYATTGTMTIGATITWSGRYQVDGGAPLDITGTVTSPATTTTVTVRQARGVLVPDPNSH